MAAKKRTPQIATAKSASGSASDSQGNHDDNGKNFLRARVEICGSRPLLQRMFGADALPLQKGERTGVAGNDPEEWRRTMMVDQNGQMYVPKTYVFGMMRDAAKYTRKGKTSLQPLVAATLQIEEDKVMLDRHLPKEGDPPADQTQPVYIHVSGVRNPATRARNVRYRLAAGMGWKARFTIIWDKTIVSREQMRAILNDAGRLVGLADGRTAGFGRFGITRFELLEGANAEA